MRCVPQGGVEKLPLLAGGNDNSSITALDLRAYEEGKEMLGQLLKAHL